MRVFVILSLLLPLFCTAPALAQSKSNTAIVDSLTKTVSALQDTVRSLREDMRGHACAESFREDAARKAQSTLDCALKFHQIVLSTIALFFTLFAIGVAIFSGAGYFLTRNKLRELDALLKERKKDIDNKVGAVEDLVKEMVTKVAQADTVLKQIRGIRENLEKDIADRQARIGSVDISEPSSAASRAQLEELSRRVELLEALGGKVTAEDYEKRSDSYYFAGRFAEALAELEKVLEANVNSAVAWNKKGFLLDELGRYQEAIQAYDAALKIKPDFHDALNNKGVSLAKLRRHEEAIQTYDAALKIKPDFHEARNNKGVSLAALGQHGAAIQAYDAALKIKPDFASAYYNRACAYSLMQKKIESQANLKRATELDSKYKAKAKTDEDFKDFWNDPDFKKIVGE